LRHTATVDGFVREKEGIGRVSVSFNVFLGNNLGEKKRKRVAWVIYRRD
jgi:hypothetical protein